MPPEELVVLVVGSAILSDGRLTISVFIAPRSVDFVLSLFFLIFILFKK